MESKSSSVFLTVVFFLIIFGFFIADFFSKPFPFEWAWGKGSKNLLNGNVARSLDQHLLQHRSLVFNKTKQHLSVFIYRWTGQTQSRAVVGRDGWIFSEWTVKQDWSESPRAIPKGLARLVKLRDWLKLYEVELLVAVPPAKVHIYPEKFTNGRIPDYLKDKYQKFCRELARLKIDFIDLESLLLQAKTQPQNLDYLYLPADHHWTQLGCKTASLAIASQLRILHPDWCDRAKGAVEIREHSKDQAPAGLYRQLGFPQDTVIPEFSHQTVNWNIHYQREFTDAERTSSPFILAADSFGYIGNMLGYLEFFLQSPVGDYLVMGGEYQGSLLKWVKNPDNLKPRHRCMIYVIWEPQIIEREMAQLDSFWEKYPKP